MSRQPKRLRHYVPFEQTLARITKKAIADSLAEIDKALAEHFGTQPAEGDWWNPDPEDPFWMLEVRQGWEGAGSWLKNDESHLTTRDPLKALRYPSRWAAVCACRRLYPDEGKFEPTEHLWIVSDASAMSASGQDPEEGLEAKPASAVPKADAR